MVPLKERRGAKVSKSISFSADWHVGHPKCLEFDRRPFKDIWDMHEALVKRYNACVPRDGVCYFLGDMGNNVKELRSVVSRLNGTKVCVLGNHDKSPTTMYNSGFDVVIYSASIYVAGHKVTMSHCPLPGIKREDCSHIPGSTDKFWHGEKRPKHQKSTVPDEGQFHLSGHIHSRKGKSTTTRVLHRQLDVGVCANNYTPVSLSQVESWVAKTVQKESDWREIPGYPDYLVNYYGQVKSFKRTPEGHLKKFYFDKDGYKCVSLRANNRPKALKVHRLVAMAFLENPKGLKQVNHKNCLKFDNTVSNLEWVSNTENQRHAWKNDRKTMSLRVEQVMEIKKLIAEGGRNKEIAERYSVDPSVISNIRRGRTWTMLDG